ncbi:MAG: chlorite dismutase family protein [Alicyclobacillus sp.]|nr:chlorite dismutase family protein [Alicyclobacillus sp.]
METVFTADLALKFNNRWVEATATERQQAANEVVELFNRFSSRVTLRGAYVTQAFRADTDLFLWMYARQPEDLQDLQLDLRRTQLGKATDTPWSFVGMSHSAEFNPDHVPSFLRGIPPKSYLCFYPYIRTAEWYLLPPEERSAMLKEHGDTGREYPGILTNGVYNFGLGDYEWLLSFETDDLTSIVNVMRRMRETQARRYTKHEWPFIVGRYYALEEALAKYV